MSVIEPKLESKREKFAKGLIGVSGDDDGLG